MFVCFYFFKQKTAYEMRISDWSSDVCSADQPPERTARAELAAAAAAEPVRDRDQIGAQLGRGRIRRAFGGDMAGGGLAREMGERGGEPGVATSERPPQGLVGAARCVRADERRGGREGGRRGRSRW